LELELELELESRHNKIRKLISTIQANLKSGEYTDLVLAFQQVDMLLCDYLNLYPDINTYYLSQKNHIIQHYNNINDNLDHHNTETFESKEKSNNNSDSNDNQEPTSTTRSCRRSARLANRYLLNDEMQETNVPTSDVWSLSTTKKKNNNNKNKDKKKKLQRHHLKIRIKK